MRCKKHITDFTSTVGVCSTCLRERLVLLIAAQAQAETQAQLTRVTSRASDESSRNPETNPPPPLIFPRSVSPYVSRRKSDYTPVWNGHDRRERLFYSTPQLGPTFYGGCTVNSNARSLKKRLSKYWIFSNLFKSRSEKFQSDPSCEEPSSSASPSWFSSVLPPRRKNKNRTANTTEEFPVGARRRYRQSDRGMSPVRNEDFADECDQCPSGSGYSSESSPWWKKTPSTNVPSSRRSRLGHGKSASGSGIFCMSPLVRANPNRRWNNKGLPPEMVAAADVRTTAAKPHLSAAASFCANRSRKLADFGRVSHNR